MTVQQIMEETVRFTRRHGIEPHPWQMRELVRLWRGFVDLGMVEGEAFEQARDLVFHIVEDAPWRIQR